MWNQVIKVSSGTCQQSVDVLSKSGTFLDFWLWQDSVATYCRWGGNLCDVYIENFLTNHLVKEFRKAVHINLPKLLPNIKGFTFVEHGDVPPVAVISSSDTAAPSSAVGLCCRRSNGLELAACSPPAMLIDVILNDLERPWTILTDLQNF